MVQELFADGWLARSHEAVIINSTAGCSCTFKSIFAGSGGVWLPSVIVLAGLRSELPKHSVGFSSGVLVLRIVICRVCIYGPLYCGDQD